MARIKTGLILAGLSALLFLSISGLLYLGSTFISVTGLRIIAILLLWLLGTCIPLSYYFGKVEARGFLHGADTFMDSIFGRVIDGMERQSTQKPAPPVIQQLPNVYRPDVLPLELGATASKKSVFDYPDRE